MHAKKDALGAGVSVTGRGASVEQKGPASSTQALEQHLKDATATMPVKANGRNPLYQGGWLAGARTADLKRGRYVFWRHTQSLRRVLLPVQPLLASCRAWKSRPPDTLDYSTRPVIWEATGLANRGRSSPCFYGRGGSAPPVNPTVCVALTLMRRPGRAHSRG